MNVVSINSKPTDPIEHPGYLMVYYTDGSQELLQVDSFGVADEMPGYLTLWSDSVEGPVGFLNKDSIKKIMTTKPDEEVNADNS